MHWRRGRKRKGTGLQLTKTHLCLNEGTFSRVWLGCLSIGGAFQQYLRSSESEIRVLLVCVVDSDAFALIVAIFVDFPVVVGFIDGRGMEFERSLF